MTTYCSVQDLDSLLEGFVSRYYGTFLDDGEDMTIGTQFGADQWITFQEANEWLQSIPHIKQLPMSTQAGGNYPIHVRMLQANLQIYHRLKSRHFGEFRDGIPTWVNIYQAKAREILADIKGQNIVFEQDTYQGESGVGIGSFTVHQGAANWYTNWETGVYTADDFPRTYVFAIDGTTNGNQVGSATFKYSNDNGVTWATTNCPTDTNWVGIGHGLAMRWESTGGTNNQLELGDSFSVRCVPLNIPVKSGNIRFVTFKRG